MEEGVGLDGGGVRRAGLHGAPAIVEDVRRAGLCVVGAALVEVSAMLKGPLGEVNTVVAVLD